MSFKSGYSPFNLDQEEVLRMTEYLGGLEMVLQCYEKLEAPVHLKNGDMFMLKSYKR